MFKNRQIDWANPHQHPQTGVYVCRRCGAALFSPAQKFDSRTGFPSFWGHLGQNVRFHLLDTYGRERTQLLCHHCGGHLGHLFQDARTPSKVRYCINADSIHLQEKD
ncbi:peptide-methionine (R)-S-oxide reductase [Rufibacter psychrotolerans]|uniref:peptide-methionine (R)-S-oxide reductase n=1 Tax=Rufibacter psychrotolerans TaxID=2812556 RepID=UPI0019687E86|nr:peptide-methionine (R)-S-oxide reductase [Rufibacter sp. SYSU D00308]